MQGRRFKIRLSSDSDCERIYQLHIDSIRYYCSGFYPENVIEAWISSKDPDNYRSGGKTIYLAENEKALLGFGILNTHSGTIDSLYLSPVFSGQGLGKLLLEKLEMAARDANLSELHLSSTLNAHHFYQRMHYRDLGETTFKLRSGVEIKCMKMKKLLTY